MQVLININDKAKALKFLEFIKELSFLEIQKIYETNPEPKNRKLPNEFFNPIKVDDFKKLDRQEIYAEILR